MAGDIEDPFWGIAPFQRPAATQVVETQRKRLLLGMAASVARRGYGATRVADVLKAVRVSRRTFYELFRDKEDCFLAAYDVAHAGMIEQIRRAQAGSDDAVTRVEAAHRRYLSFMQQHPQLAQAFLVGVLEAGPRAEERRHAAYQDFAALHASLHRQLRRQQAGLPEVPRPAFVALTAGTNLVVVDELRRRGAERLMSLLPTLLYLSYSVYGLPDVAARALSPRRKRITSGTRG